ALNVLLMHVPPPFCTVTDTCCVVLAAPMLSNAVALNTVPAPSGTRCVSNVVENGELVSVTLVPFGGSNRTLATVPSGSEAVALTVIVPLTVEPPVGAVIVTVGGWFVFVTVTLAFA